MADQTRTESEGFYEMLWDCDHCGTVGLLGKSQRYCANCGGPQNPDKRYFPTPEQQKRVDGHQFEGADRTCPNCDSPMGALAKNCTHCGAPMDGSKEVKGVETPVAPVKKKKSKKPLVFIILVLLFAGIFGIYWRCVRTQSVNLTLAQHKWERAIAIEQYGDHEQAGWKDQIPVVQLAPGAPVNCYMKQRTTKQVADGEECHTEKKDKKDGTFEQLKVCKPKYKSQGVDDQWCNYTTRGWQKIDGVKTSGNGTTPQWPVAAGIPDKSPDVVGAKRMGARDESLIFDFGKDGTCTVKDSTWQKYKDGAKLKVEQHSNGDLVCDGL